MNPSRVIDIRRVQEIESTLSGFVHISWLKDDPAWLESGCANLQQISSCKTVHSWPYNDVRQLLQKVLNIVHVPAMEVYLC